MCKTYRLELTQRELSDLIDFVKFATSFQQVANPNPDMHRKRHPVLRKAVVAWHDDIGSETGSISKYFKP